MSLASVSTALSATSQTQTNFVGGQIARVLALEAEGYLEVQAVQGHTSPFRTRTAASLLLQPQVGDTVFVLHNPHNETAWVTMVLSRTQHVENPAILAVPGAKHMVLRSPFLRLEAQEELALHSKNFGLSAARAFVHLGVLRASAYVLKLVTQRLNVWAKVLHTQAESVVMQAEQRTTRIDGADLLRTEQFVLKSEQLVQVKTPGVVQVLAQGNVAIDGKQIFMG